MRARAIVLSREFIGAEPSCGLRMSGTLDLTPDPPPLGEGGYQCPSTFRGGVGKGFTAHGPSLSSPLAFGGGASSGAAGAASGSGSFFGSSLTHFGGYFLRSGGANVGVRVNSLGGRFFTNVKTV